LTVLAIHCTTIALFGYFQQSDNAILNDSRSKTLMFCATKRKAASLTDSDIFSY